MLNLWIGALRGFVAISVVAATLGACGGGGGEGVPSNQAPTAVAKLNGEAVLFATARFDTAGTNDPEGKLSTRRWDYGDGQSGSLDTHVYSATGTFTAVYTVTDDQGATASASVPVNVAKCSSVGSQAAELSPYPTVCMQTTLGELVLEVYPAKAPQTAANFLKYVVDGFYAGTLIHRVVPGFVIQGGGFTSGMVSKPPTYPPIPLESNNTLHNWQYTLAMARTSVPDSATSQFYVNLVDNFGLDYDPTQSGANGYAVFGQVISGTNVVDQIALATTGTVAGFSNVPVVDVVIRSTTRMP